MRQLLGVALLVVSSLAYAAIDTYEFESEAQRERFYELSNELRCPKCQNQNIADSNAPIATDMRREVHRLLQEGESDETIVQFMVSRYGDFVRYRPGLTSQTMVLWFAPLLFLVIGIGILLVLVRRRRAVSVNQHQHLSEAEQQRLRDLLEKKGSND
ncbi:cytochrome c-type biogenesis protein CcmH [Halopseudomonas nanhaiensis]|uniref:cytochrome c-type biogenesis protein n=1 Tax=Halopseudomonas nanhaiensis TaxID=2830842 RepID=UPI001CC19B3A|nr:cytochrome c-type biogenesis protein [Halopseudomonas nanhaiensis]UAX00004.1 cytochrome c-type biogenesis protein CcmH [Halopseudomonas nanhaiensis]